MLFLFLCSFDQNLNVGEDKILSVGEYLLTRARAKAGWRKSKPLDGHWTKEKKNKSRGCGVLTVRVSLEIRYTFWSRHSKEDWSSGGNRLFTVMESNHYLLGPHLF